MDTRHMLAPPARRQVDAELGEGLGQPTFRSSPWCPRPDRPPGVGCLLDDGILGCEVMHGGEPVGLKADRELAAAHLLELRELAARAATLEAGVDQVLQQLLET